MRMLIVDPEPSPLLQLCNEDNEVDVVGSATSGEAAIRAVANAGPDLLLLEVRLADMSGFEVLQAIDVEGQPLVIVVSSVRDHAVAAFEAGAVDYLLKPVNASRFRCAVSRARTQLQRRAELVAAGQRATAAALLVGEREKRLYPLSPTDVDYIESDGNYVWFRTGGESYISRDSVKRLAGTLAGCGFVRIERSLLLNLRALSFAEPAGHGTFAFTLKSGMRLQSSATYREEILRVLPLARSNAS